MTVQNSKIYIALGNERPPALQELETKVLECLLQITLERKDPAIALRELVKCDEWSRMEQLPSSHPAATFFRPVDVTPRIEELEPAGSNDDEGNAIDQAHTNNNDDEVGPPSNESNEQDVNTENGKQNESESQGASTEDVNTE